MVKTIRFVKRESRHTFRNRGGAAMAAASDRDHTNGVDCLGGTFFGEDVPILYKSFAVSGIFKNKDIKQAFGSFFNHHDENKILFKIKKERKIKIITVLNEHPETNLAYIEFLSELQGMYPIQIEYIDGRWLYGRTPEHEDENAAFLDPPQKEDPGVDTIYVRLHPQKVRGIPYPKKTRIPRTRHTSRRGPMPRHEPLRSTRSRSRTRSPSKSRDGSISTHSSSGSSDNSISSRSGSSVSSRSS